jgi:hypothetical protein
LGSGIENRKTGERVRLFCVKGTINDCGRVAVGKVKDSKRIVGGSSVGATDPFGNVSDYALRWDHQGAEMSLVEYAERTALWLQREDPREWIDRRPLDYTFPLSTYQYKKSPSGTFFGVGGGMLLLIQANGGSSGPGNGVAIAGAVLLGGTFVLDLAHGTGRKLETWGVELQHFLVQTFGAKRATIIARMVDGSPEPASPKKVSDKLFQDFLRFFGG